MLLLDTNVVVWMAEDYRLVSVAALAALTQSRYAGEPVAISTTTLWEIAVLAAKGRLRFSPSVEVFLERLENTYRILPLTRHIALAAANFSDRYPKDPADRQIGSTALVHGLQLVTADKPIRLSGEVPCIW